MRKILLLEGGAVGHMAHPFNLPQVNTGADLIEFFNDAAEHLLEGEASVKIDGVNVSFKLVDGPEGKEFAVDRGSLKPIDVEGITASRVGERFGEGHGLRGAVTTLLTIFNEALPLIGDELEMMGMQDNPTIFLNTEYVLGQTNVTQYDENFLAIHGVNQFYEKTHARDPSFKRPGTPKPAGLPTNVRSREIPYDSRVLDSLIKKVDPIADRYGFKMYGSVPTETLRPPNFQKTLSTQFSIVGMPGEDVNGKTGSATLGQLLAQAENPRDADVVLTSGKKVKALSKLVYTHILNGSPLTELVANQEDAKLVIDGAVFYHATRMLGNDILNVLTSPMGDVANHEGIVLRDPRFGPDPVKITGEFILKGMESAFQQSLNEQQQYSARKIGVVPMAAKPFHAGHMFLIDMASNENDEVIVFVSLTDRKRTGEFPVYGSQMKQIWNEHLSRIMPKNVNIDLMGEGEQPVKAVYELLADANEVGSKNIFNIYSDPEDTRKNYPVASRVKYFGDLHNNGNVRFIGEENPEKLTRGVGTPDISGTKAREALTMNDLETFASYMPSGVDAEAIYNILAEPSKEEELMEMLYGLISEQMDIREQKSKYQIKIAKGHSRSKKRLIGKGGNKDTGGGKGHKRPSMKRSKSAPAGFGAIGEVEELEEELEKEFEKEDTSVDLTKNVEKLDPETYQGQHDIPAGELPGEKVKASPTGYVHTTSPTPAETAEGADYGMEYNLSTDTTEDWKKWLAYQKAVDIYQEPKGKYGETGPYMGGATWAGKVGAESRSQLKSKTIGGKEEAGMKAGTFGDQRGRWSFDPSKHGGKRSAEIVKNLQAAGFEPDERGIYYSPITTSISTMWDVDNPAAFTQKKAAAKKAAPKKVAPKSLPSTYRPPPMQEQTIPAASTDIDLTKDIGATSTDIDFTKDAPEPAEIKSLDDIKRDLGIGEVPGGMGTGKTWELGGDVKLGVGAKSNQAGIGVSFPLPDWLGESKLKEMSSAGGGSGGGIGDISGAPGGVPRPKKHKEELEEEEELVEEIMNYLFNNG